MLLGKAPLGIRGGTPWDKNGEFRATGPPTGWHKEERELELRWLTAHHTQGLGCFLRPDFSAFIQHAAAFYALLALCWGAWVPAYKTVPAFLVSPSLPGDLIMDNSAVSSTRYKRVCLFCSIYYPAASFLHQNMLVDRHREHNLKKRVIRYVYSQTVKAGHRDMRPFGRNQSLFTVIVVDVAYIHVCILSTTSGFGHSWVSTAAGARTFPQSERI